MSTNFMLVHDSLNACILRSKFLLMGAQKPKAVVKLFDTLQVATVALIDTDTIWLRDPFPWLDNHFDADMYVTTGAHQQ